MALDYNEAKRIAEAYLNEPGTVDFSELPQAVINECAPMITFAHEHEAFDKLANSTFGVDAKVIQSFIKRYENQKVGDQRIIDEPTFKLLGLNLLAQMAGLNLEVANDDGVDTKRFAAFVWGRLYAIINKETEDLLIYNHKKGLFEDDDLAFSRIVYFYLIWLSGGGANWSGALVRNIRALVAMQSQVVSSNTLNGNFLVCRNGDLDLTDFEFSPHSPHTCMTIGNDIEFDEMAQAPIFEATLSRVLPDQLEQVFIMEFFGYVLGTSVKANKFLLAVGDGATGKSTILSPLVDLVGTRNVTSVPLQKLSTRFGLQPLLDKRLNLVAESDSSSSIDATALKNLTGGESLNVDRKNQTEITARIVAKHIFVVNNLPSFNDKTNGIARRLIVLPFTQRIDEADQDKDLNAKLHAEAPGILNLALSGLKRLRQNDYIFTESEAMKAARKSVLNNQPPMDDYVNTQLEAADGYVMDANQLRAEITRWFKQNHHPLGSMTSPRILWPELIASVERVMGIQVEKGASNGRTVMRNIRMRDSDDSGASEAKIIDAGGAKNDSSIKKSN